MYSTTENKHFGQRKDTNFTKRKYSDNSNVRSPKIFNLNNFCSLSRFIFTFV